MRCLHCNIDLPDAYKRCPLCNGEAAATPPLLQNLHAAEYPTVAYKPYPLPLKKYFTVFFCIVAALSLLANYLYNRQLSTAILGICILLALWGVVLRQFMVHEQSFGDRTSKALVFSVPLLLILAKNGLVSTGILLCMVAPCLLLGCELLLGVYMLKRKTKAQRVAGITHQIGYCLCSLALLLYAVLSQQDTWLFSLVAVFVAAFFIGFTAARAPALCKAELCARFRA